MALATMSGPDPMNALLDAVSGAEPGRDYLRRGGRTVAVAEIAALRDRFSARFAPLGIGTGTRVATLVPTTEHGIALIFALARAGANWIAPNSRLPASALAPLVSRCAATHLVCDPAQEELARAIAALTGVRVLVLSDATPGAASLVALETDTNDATPLDIPEEADTAEFALFFTSGTTGRSKAVKVSQAMLIYAARGALAVSGARAGDVLHCWEPLHHVGGAQLTLMPLLVPIRLELFPRFSASAFWSEVRACGATHMHFLGGILDILLKAPAGPEDRDHGLRVAWGGGARPESWPAFAERFGVEVRECYGMTECSSVATVNPRGVEHGIGWPLPWFDITIRDPQTGAELPAGQAGEIVIAETDPGALSAGYLGNSEATAQTFRDGRLFTSDLGMRDDDGAYHFLGRLGDRVRVRGENVSAWEVEHVVRAHPEVCEVAVIGVDAEIGEQELKMFVQPFPGRAVDPVALTDWLRGRLASFQVPRYVARIDGFEFTPSQRIKKGLLPAGTTDCWDRDAVRRAGDPAAGSRHTGEPQT